MHTAQGQILILASLVRHLLLFRLVLKNSGNGGLLRILTDHFLRRLDGNVDSHDALWASEKSIESHLLVKKSPALTASDACISF